MAKIKIEDIEKELASQGWQALSNYINLDTPMKFQCPEGHSVFQTWKKMRVNLECPICKKNLYKDQDNKVIPKKKNEKRVLAFDQATHISGYAVYSDGKLLKYGIFETNLDDEIARDHQIKEWAISLINLWQPDIIGIEGIQYQQNVGMGVTTFETLARLQGILMETFYDLKIPYVVCHTATWRNHCQVKGKTRADRKRSMQLLVKQWYDITITDDCADAIGIGKYVSETKGKPVIIENWE